MTEQEQNRFDYLQASYPRGLRGKAETTTSILYNYDYVRAFMLNVLASLIADGGKQLLVNTATNLGLTAWETFLGITTNELLSDAVRRIAIKSRLTGNGSTIANLKEVVETFLAPGTVYGITEAWQGLNPAADETRTYFVDTPVGSLTPTEQASLTEILEQIQPAHCELIFNYIQSLIDSVGVSESISGSYLHSSFLRAIEGTPAGTDKIRGTELIPLSGPYWS